MAGEVPPLNVDILVSLGNLTSAVDQATAGLNKIGESAKAQESKFSSLKTIMGGVFAGNLMTKGVEVLTAGLHDAVKAIEDTQVATERLSTALNNAKQNTAANRAEIEKTSQKMSALGFATSTTESAYGTLITATGSTTQATKLMSMAADLARYKHEDLATAATTLARGTQGSARAFKELGITLDSHLPKNQAIAKAFDELNGKIGGQAVGYTHTFAGQMEVLKAKFDDVANKVGSVVMPILTKLFEFIDKILIPVIAFLYKVTIGEWLKQIENLWNAHEGLRKGVGEVLKYIVEGFGFLLEAIGKVIGAASHLPFIGGHFKGIAQGVDAAAESVKKFGSGLDSLANKKISFGGKSLADQLATAGTSGDGGVTGVTGDVAGGGVNKAADKAAKAVAAALAKRNTEIKKYNDEAVKLEDQMNAALADRQQKMDAATTAHNDAITKANEAYNQKFADLNQVHDDAIKNAQDNFNSAIENATATHEQAVLDIKQQFADKAASIIQAAADKQQSIIQQSIALMTNAWQNATKIDINKLFTDGGSTASGLVTQLKDRLAEILKLQKDAGLLAAQGYNQSFIDEVIAQGPKQGDALAQSVLNATPDTKNSIQSLYNQINTTSQTGLDALAKQMNTGATFATQALADAYAAVPAELQKQLAANSNALQTALDKENDNFTKAQATAQATLDKATKTANDTLNKGLQAAKDTLSKALQAADDAFTKATTSISDAAMKKLDALQAKLNSVSVSLGSLGASTASISGYEASKGFTNSTTLVNPLGGTKDKSNYSTTTNINITGYNLSDPNATAQQTASAMKYGSPLTITPQIITGLSGSSVKGN